MHGTAITDPKSYIGAESTNPPPNRSFYGGWDLEDEDVDWTTDSDMPEAIPVSDSEDIDVYNHINIFTHKSSNGNNESSDESSDDSDYIAGNNNQDYQEFWDQMHFNNRNHTKQ